jgi:hypothetical protein
MTQARARCRGRGRPPKRADQRIRAGVVIQPRFPLWLHRRVKTAARKDRTAMTRWILNACVHKLGADCKDLPDAMARVEQLTELARSLD